ncbi:phosphate ABC transporter substrate-binding protein [Streptococcus minor]|uniref:Phosphate ABC transporter substrate-binding protein n=1 Tax=Streptococcus minor TaxID=229549 RepID=A0A3P1VCP4_9STRE|nr:substrate-binding domain-containing protein [Streptococcus minor]RRD31220.1 phosphate ABC transporter substrate-binding protein [Streptococcus minor]
MKKISILSTFAFVGLASLSFLTACSGSSDSNGNQSATINVVSREEGSGTRGAFIELFGVEEKDTSGEKVDLTTDKAIVTNSTAVMLTTVAGDVNAIGYASLGSLDETNKVLQIDGVDATVENIKNGSYKISRPFNIVTQSDVSDATKDFISFILSSDGQAVVEKAGYISIDHTSVYTAKVDKGKVVISGSSSVTPVMEKLKEAYSKANPGVAIEVQQSDSTTGIINATEGTADIGMASRSLADTELKKGVIETVIALDGIGVIVNKDSKVTGLTSEQVKAIYTGKITSWDDLSN